MAIVDTQKEAAAALGISAPSLRQWQKEPWFPHRADGRFDVTDIAKRRDEAGRKGGELPERMRQIKAAITGEELKQARLDTELKEIKLARFKKDVYPATAAQLAISTALTTISDLLDQWLETVPVRSGVPDEFQSKLHDRLRAEFDAGRQRIEDELVVLLKQLDDIAEAAA